VVKSKIKAALEMQAIIQSSESSADKSFSQKPNLLIIDEIDGASSGGGSEVSPQREKVCKRCTILKPIPTFKEFHKGTCQYSNSGNQCEQ
jgi:hypothetical protein